MDCLTSHSTRDVTSINAFAYIKRNGVTLDSFYPRPYPQPGPCLRKPLHPATKIETFYMVQTENEETMKTAVALIGPLSVNIRVTRDFFYYSSGVFYDVKCAYSKPVTNHAAVVVGYGIDTFLGEFWIVQNSWGKLWGELGFVRMARNSVVNCGIAAAAIYPVI